MTSFGNAFKSARAAGDKTFEWNGKKYTTELATSPNRANKVGTAPASRRDDEAGMSRGTRPANPRDAEAGRSRGMPAGITDGKADAPKTTTSSGYSGGAGRGGQGGPSIDDLMNAPGRYNAGAGRGLHGTGAEGYRSGGMVRVSKGSTPYKIKR